MSPPNSLLSLCVFLIFKFKLIDNFYLIKFSTDCSFTFMSARQNWTGITYKCTKAEQLIEIWTCKSRGSEFKSHPDLELDLFPSFNPWPRLPASSKNMGFTKIAIKKANL